MIDATEVVKEHPLYGLVPDEVLVQSIELARSMEDDSDE